MARQVRIEFEASTFPADCREPFTCVFVGSVSNNQARSALTGSALTMNSARAIPASVERGQMPSSVIREASYDDTAKEIHVTFVSGRVYIYSGVARSIYDAFCKAPSKGAFFNVAIRGRYPFRELPQDRKRSAR
jgi:hypothetical protein